MFNLHNGIFCIGKTTYLYRNNPHIIERCSIMQSIEVRPKLILNINDPMREDLPRTVEFYTVQAIKYSLEAAMLRMPK